MEEKDLLSEMSEAICKHMNTLACTCVWLEKEGRANSMKYNKHDVQNALLLLLHTATVYGVRNGTLTVGNICQYQDRVANAVAVLAGENMLQM